METVQQQNIKIQQLLPPTLHYSSITHHSLLTPLPSARVIARFVRNRAGRWKSKLEKQGRCAVIVIIILLMNPLVVVLAMINGMIGGLILVLPILAMNGGTVLSFLVIIITGFFSYYSCALCVKHLGSHSDLDKAIYFHFGQSKIVRIFYDLMVFSNLILIELLYFDLIVQQWEGLFAPSIANPLTNIIFLFILIFVLKYVHFGAELLGYGLISIVLYCFFLIWLLASAKPGSNHIPQFGTGGANLAASMGQAFSIQTFFIPVLRQLPASQSKNYLKYVLYAYLIGGAVYLYIAYAGAFGILNRLPVIKPVQTIEDYFSRDQWEVAIVQVIYLVHLYSAFGEFMLVCKKRFFSVLSYCGIQESKDNQIFNIPETVFILGVLILTLGVYFAGVSIDNLIEINGAVIGFFFIYFVPAAMHFKCLYFPQQRPLLELKPRITRDFEKQRQNQQQLAMQNEVELTEREKITVEVKLQKVTEEPNNINQNLGFQNNSQNKQGLLQKNIEQHEIKLERDSNIGEVERSLQPAQGLENAECPCEKSKSKIMIGFDVLSILGMVGLGLFIMVNGIISVASGTS